MKSIRRNEVKVRLLTVALIASAALFVAYPQGQTIEQVAQTIASQHNANAKALLDEMTVSTSAKAVGRNVRFEYVLRVKKGLPAPKLREFSEETQREIVPRTCQVNAKNEAFKRGLHYTFTYTNTYGEKLAEFHVDRAKCDRYK